MSKIKPPKIVTIAVLSLATVILWIIFSVVASITKPTDINVPEKATEPVSPTLDLPTLESLSQKIYFSENSNIQTIITPVEEVVVEEIVEEVLIEEEVEEEAVSTESADLEESSTQ